MQYYRQSEYIWFGERKFHYGRGMKQNWAENKVVLLDYVVNKFGQSVEVSILSGKIIVTEVDNKLISKFKTEDDKNMHVEALECW